MVSRIVVISNIFNFMAEKVIEAIPPDHNILLVHVNKTRSQLRESTWRGDREVVDGPCGHGQVIDMLLASRLAGDEAVLFVDHDVVFGERAFSQMFGDLEVKSLESPSAFIVAQKHEPMPCMLCPYVFRTTPMFLVRPWLRPVISFARDAEFDTGQRIANTRPDLVALVDEWLPYNEKCMAQGVF